MLFLIAENKSVHPVKMDYLFIVTLKLIVHNKEL